MGNFEDRLIGDLMEQHGPALATVERPEPRRRSNRPLWMTGGALAIALAVAGVLTLTSGSSSPAYAVTQNPNGTVTLTLADMTGVDGANAELRKLGLPVLVVPFQRGCAGETAFEAPANGQPTAVYTRGAVTFALNQIPAKDTLVVSASRLNVTLNDTKSKIGVLTAGLLKGRPPVCDPEK